MPDRCVRPKGWACLVETQLVFHVVPMYTGAIVVVIFHSLLLTDLMDCNLLPGYLGSWWVP